MQYVETNRGINQGIVMNRLYLADLAAKSGVPLYGPGSVMEWFHNCLDDGRLVWAGEGNKYYFRPKAVT